MFCSRCGIEIPDDARFCHKCGYQIPFGTESTVPEKNSLSLRCPDCGAQLTYGTEIDHVTCNFCGSVIMINDEAAKKDRILKAESNAIIRDTATRIRYENEQHKRELEKMELENDHKLSPYKDLTPFQRMQYSKEKKSEAEVKIKELEVKQAEIEAQQAPEENRMFVIAMGFIVVLFILILLMMVLVK